MLRIRQPRLSLTLNRIENGIGVFVVSAIASVLILWIDKTLATWIVGVIAGFLIAIAFWDTFVVAPRAIPRTLITIDDDSCRIRKGWLNRELDVIPVCRVTVVNREVGFIARRLGLATVKVLSTTNTVTLPRVTIRDSVRIMVHLQRHIAVNDSLQGTPAPALKVPEGAPPLAIPPASATAPATPVQP